MYSSEIFSLEAGHRFIPWSARRMAEAGRVAHGLRDAIGAVGEIAAEDFVGAFAAEGDGDVLAAELGEEPDGQGSGVGAGLVRVVGELANCAFEILLGIEVELLVLRAVALSDFANVWRLVEAVAGEGNGESAQGAWRRPARRNAERCWSRHRR